MVIQSKFESSVLRHFVVAVTMLLTSSLGHAGALDFSGFVGEYELVQTVRGVCAPRLRVEQMDFLNQRAEHSLGFYGSGIERGRGGGPIYEELTNLNAGVDFHFVPNPMLGGYVGTYYNHETLEGDRISSHTRSRSMLGVIQTESKLKAEISGNLLEYTWESYNGLISPKVSVIEVCRYEKKSSSPN